MACEAVSIAPTSSPATLLTTRSRRSRPGPAGQLRAARPCPRPPLAPRLPLDRNSRIHARISCRRDISGEHGRIEHQVVEHVRLGRPGPSQHARVVRAWETETCWTTRRGISRETDSTMSTVSLFAASASAASRPTSSGSPADRPTAKGAHERLVVPVQLQIVAAEHEGSDRRIHVRRVCYLEIRRTRQCVHYVCPARHDREQGKVQYGRCPQLPNRAAPVGLEVGEKQSPCAPEPGRRAARSSSSRNAIRSLLQGAAT